MKQLIERLEERDFDPQVKGVVSLPRLQIQAKRVTEACGEAYNESVRLKLMMDTAEEIPNYLRKIYDRNLKVFNKAADAKKDAYQSQMELRRVR